MIQFTATIQQFAEQGEKTGWTYVEVPADLAEQLQPDGKKSFRVKGKLDELAIKAVALIPMGGGAYILPLNAAMRKALRKKKGAMLNLRLSIDYQPLAIPPALLDCLADEPEARNFFDQLKPSHRNYFIKWIGGVSSDTAVAKRIAQVITAMLHKQDFVTMVRSQKAEKAKWEGR